MKLPSLGIIQEGDTKKVLSVAIPKIQIKKILSCTSLSFHHDLGMGLIKLGQYEFSSMNLISLDKLQNKETSSWFGWIYATIAVWIWCIMFPIEVLLQYYFRSFVPKHHKSKFSYASARVSQWKKIIYNTRKWFIKVLRCKFVYIGRNKLPLPIEETIKLRRYTSSPPE